jgi:hypothetical protein
MNFNSHVGGEQCFCPILQTLNKQQWDALFPPMDARVKLERLSEDIKNIKNAISDSVVAGVVSAITAFLSGLFYEMNNGVYILTAIVAGISLYFYLARCRARHRSCSRERGSQE